MLEACFGAIYRRGDLAKAEQLLNAGLISNGSFYWLGAHMAETITARHGNSELGRLLAVGSPQFFRRYLAMEQETPWRPGREVLAKVNELASFMARPGTPAEA